MDNQVKVALIGALAGILTAILFTPLGVYISHDFLNTEPTPVLTSIEPDKESPQFVETQINWTATANNPRKEPLFYRFNLNGPSTNNTWKIVQNWGTQNKWSWYPTEPGNYNIEVQVSYGKNNEIPDSIRMNYYIFKVSANWIDAGRDASKAHRLHESIIAYDKAIKINPMNSDAWIEKGLAFRDLGKSNEAIAAFDNAIEINPQNFNAWFQKGFVLINSNKNDEALAAYEKSIEIDPKNSPAWYDKGNALSNLGKYDEAIKAYDKAIELDPRNSLAWNDKAWNDKGFALEKLNKFGEALAAYKKAIAINQFNLAAQDNLNRLNKSNDAIQAVDNAI